MLQKMAAALVFGLIAAASVSATTAAGESGSVVFKLTLRGEVPASDSFRRLLDTDPPSIIEPGLLVCGPRDPDGGVIPVCRSGETYEIESPMLPVGTVLTYGVVRNEEQRVTALSGTATVSAGKRSTTVSLTYDYGFGQLPNTATHLADPLEGPSPTLWIIFGVFVTGCAVLAWGIARRRLRSLQ